MNFVSNNLMTLLKIDCTVIITFLKFVNMPHVSSPKIILITASEQNREDIYSIRHAVYAGELSQQTTLWLFTSLFYLLLGFIHWKF